MMKKLAALLLAAAMLLGVSPIAPAFALEAPGVTVTRDGAAVELVELGPDETVKLTASCPADWYILGGAVLQNASAELELTWAALGFVQAGSSVQVAAAAVDGEGNVWTSAPVTVTAVAPAQEPQLPQDPAEPQLPDAPVDIPAEEPPAAPEPVDPYEEMSVEDLYALVMSAPTEEEAAAVLSSLSETKLADLEAYAASLEPEPEPLPPYVYPSYVSVGPFVDYIAPWNYYAPMLYAANSTEPAVKTDKAVNTTKTATAVPGKDGVYQIDLGAQAHSEIITTSSGVDIILMLDMSRYMNDTRLAALKAAVTNFIDNTAERSPESRIAIVTYNNSSSVITGTKVAKEGALVRVGGKDLETDPNSNVENLRNIVAGLNYTTYTPANSNLAIADAVRIFQSANDDSKLDEYNKAYNQRTRVAILFSAGTPGDGNWDGDDYTVAQAGISLSVYLKGDRSTQVGAPANSDFAGSGKWSGQATPGSGLYGDIVSSKDDTYVYAEGCGATVYTVGLNLPTEPVDPEDIITKDELQAYANVNNRNEVNGIKTEVKDGLFVNEYLYRISQHRVDGAHYAYSDSRLESRFKAKYDALHPVTWTSGWRQYSYDVKKLFDNDNSDKALYWFYPDSLTRNQPDGYFLTADDEHINDLTSIFTDISVQTGETVESAVIRDYISADFVPVDEDGNALQEGDTIISGGQKGTVCHDNNGWYIEWEDVELSPPGTDGTGAESFASTIYVKANTFGGSQIYTNIPTISGVYPSENEVYPFGSPTVDVPISYQIASQDQNIYLGGQADLRQLLAYAAGFEPNGTNNAHVTITYTLKQGSTVIGTLTIPAGKNTSSCNWTADEGNMTPVLYEDTTYTIECTVSPVGTGSTVEAQTYTTEATVFVYAPEITISDMEIPLGEEPNFTDAAPARTVEWKHQETPAVAGNMTGDEPTLSYSFTPEPNGSNYKADTYVTASVSIGNKQVDSKYLTFKHADCQPGEAFDPEQGQFIVHVIPFSLTIKKEGWERIDENQSFVFTVKRESDNSNITFDPLEVVVHGESSVTINGLPKGTYTVEEESGWSWRYEATNATAAFTSDDINIPSKTVTVTNTRQKIKWLSGCAWCDNTWINGSVTSSSAPAEADNKSRKGVTD